MTKPLDRLAEAVKDRCTLERERGAGAMALGCLIVRRGPGSPDG
jgi:hypothetical protein